MSLFEVPLVLCGHIVKRDRRSWLWMCNQRGFISYPATRLGNTKNYLVSTRRYYDTELDEQEFAGKQEQRYHMYPLGASQRNKEESDRFDPFKYCAGYAGLRMYDPLNFNDEPVWKYNT